MNRKQNGISFISHKICCVCNIHRKDVMVLASSAMLLMANVHVHDARTEARIRWL